MKGRPQEKNGYWYIVIYRGKGLSPKWISTGLKVIKGKSLPKKKVNEVIEEYAAQEEHRQLSCTPTVFSTQPSSAIKGPLFSEIIKSYLSVAKNNVKINTYEKYQYAALRHIIPWFEAMGKQVADMNALDVQEYMSAKIENGLSKETLKSHKTVINQSFEYAIFPLKFIDNNPALGIRLGKSKSKAPNYYEPDLLNDLIAKISMEGTQIATPVILAAYYGLRREEVLGIQWDAIDFTRKTILICRTAVKTNSGTVYSDTMKSESSLRTMPLFPAVEAYLKKLYCEQKAMQSTYKKAYPKHKDICRWQDGRLVRPDYITRRFTILIKKYDMPPLSFHQLRHSSASLLINEGHSLKEVQEWLGHSSSRSTEIYAHMFHKAKEKMAVSIGRTLIILETTAVSDF